MPFQSPHDGEESNNNGNKLHYIIICTSELVWEFNYGYFLKYFLLGNILK